MTEIIDNDLGVCEDKLSLFTFLFYRKMVRSLSAYQTTLTKRSAFARSIQTKSFYD